MRSYSLSQAVADSVLHEIKPSEKVEGVTGSFTTDIQPLIVNPTMPLKELAMGIMLGAWDEDTVSSLAARLAYLDRELDDKDRDLIQRLAGGLCLSEIVNKLLGANDPSRFEPDAAVVAEGVELTDEERKQARNRLVGDVAKVLTSSLIDVIDGIQRGKRRDSLPSDNGDSIRPSGVPKIGQMTA